MMLKLCQRDARWAGEKLGKSNVTVGRYGCTITCLSMLSTYFGCTKYPNFLARNLDFTSDGLLYWNSIERELCFAKKQRFYGYQENLIKEALDKKDMAVILQVQNYHWVVAMKKVPFTKQCYLIADPWTGKITTTKIYKDNITGGCTLIAKKIGQ